ncbi:MAG TPA: hypothetical protein VMS77_03605 [Conexivisphaerales archaeon]|nr:hypothetical protein [Conexivisphaerales archaeon]
MYIQFSPTYLPYSVSIPMRHNGSNVVVMGQAAGHYDFMSIDARLPGKAVLASSWSAAHSSPSSWGGTITIGGDQAIPVEMLNLNLATGGSATFKEAIGQGTIV